MRWSRGPRAVAGHVRGVCTACARHVRGMCTAGARHADHGTLTVGIWWVLAMGGSVYDCDCGGMIVDTDDTDDADAVDGRGACPYAACAWLWLALPLLLLLLWLL
ncbi:hypothetical protein BC831DRAFT_448175 [Entophlyctis helioformis]|nr:hypothetical protein BC831DRAFT_448175 [Entophlyctis helioformis]